MKRIWVLIAILVAVSHEAMGGVTLEVVKGVGNVIGRKAGQEAVEAGGKNVAKSVAKELVKEGSESVAKQTGKALVKSLGDDVARSATAASDDLAKGLGSLSAQNARRLQMLSSDLHATGKAAEVANLIAKGGSGDQVVDFLWRNKAALAGGTVLTTLLMNPDAVINAGGNVGSALIDVAGTSIALPLAENAPIMTAGLLMLALIVLLAFLTWLLLGHQPIRFLFRILSDLRNGLARKQPGGKSKCSNISSQIVCPSDANRKQPI